MVAQEDLDRPAALFDPDALLENVRAALEEQVKGSTDQFDDDALMAYMDTYWDEQLSVEAFAAQVVRHAMDRYHRRPNSGHEKAQVHACQDDPVGLRIARQMRLKQRAKLQAAKDRSEDQAKAAARGE